jgi:hypothetical protein
MVEGLGCSLGHISTRSDLLEHQHLQAIATYVKKGGNDHIAGKMNPVDPWTGRRGVAGLPSFAAFASTPDVDDVVVFETDAWDASDMLMSCITTHPLSRINRTLRVEVGIAKSMDGTKNGS